MHELRYRQIHLDFHTSPHIPEIGEAFDAEHWVSTLKRAAVDSVTLFATCHHGWRYYEGQVGPKHPHCQVNLLKQQFDALKANDINAPIYLTAGVNDAMAQEHPEWREIDYEGRYAGWNKAPTQAGFKKMCFNSPYLDYLCDQISEVARTFPKADGIFLDIIFQGECCCTNCMDSMAQKGYDPLSAEDRKAHGEEVLLKYYEKTTAAAKVDDANMPVFHNSGHITIGQRDILQYFSHLELESLPTGGWGYDHFPMSAKYAQTLPYDVMGMTGKFHTTWGEFGGFKHPNALRYECAAMIAYGTKCSIGDQLHPSGKLDETTYDYIGQAYREVEAKEPWCRGAKAQAEVAVLSSIAVNGLSVREHAGEVGAGRMLLEAGIQFEVIDGLDPFKDYKVIICPDDLQLDDEMVKRLQDHMDRGGQLLLTGTSGLREGKQLFDMGADFEGESPFSPDYVLPCESLRPEGQVTPFVMYAASQRLKVSSGESLGVVHDPYFNRSYQHFCSHQHTPFRPEPSGFDWGVRTDKITYLSHPVFSIYRGYGAVNVKTMVVKALEHMLGDDIMVKSNLPSTARVVLNQQAQDQRYVLHLLFANTISRGGSMNLSGGTLSGDGLNIQVIEELLPLHQTELDVQLDEQVHSVTLEPQGEAIDFVQEKGRVRCVVEKFSCHQMVVFHTQS